MKLMTLNTMAVATMLAMAATCQAQTTVHHTANTVTAVGSGQSEGTGFGEGGQGTSSTVKDDLFAGTEVFAKNATDVTEITMDPDTLSMVNGKDKDKAHNTVLQVVRTYEYDKPGMYNIADVDKIRERLNTGDWHCSLHERSLKTGESTDVCNKRRTDDLFEQAIITVEPKELTFIHTISHHALNMMGPGMGMLPGGLGSLSSLATLDPEMLELRMQLNILKSGMAFHRMGPNMMVIPSVDEQDLAKSIDKAIKAWDKSGDKIQKFVSPDGMHELMIAPAAPETPEMPPAPAMPVPPALETAPPAQQTTPAPAAPHAEAAPMPLRTIPAEQL